LRLEFFFFCCHEIVPFGFF